MMRCVCEYMCVCTCVRVHILLSLFAGCIRLMDARAETSFSALTSRCVPRPLPGVFSDAQVSVETSFYIVHYDHFTLSFFMIYCSVFQ